MAEAPTLFHISYYNSRVGKIAIVTMDNGEDYKKPNTFGERALESLHAAMDKIAADKELEGHDALRQALHICRGSGPDAGPIYQYVSSKAAESAKQAMPQ